MKDFIDKIREYVTVSVDASNSQIVDIRLIRKPRCNLIKLETVIASRILPPGCSKEKGVQGNSNRMIMTPIGKFLSINDCARTHDITPATVSYRCRHWTKHDFFYYKE